MSQNPVNVELDEVEPRRLREQQMRAISEEHWESDTTVWQDPEAVNPFTLRTLSEEYEHRYPWDQQVPTVVDAILGLPAFDPATEQYRTHLEAIVLSRLMQRHPSRAEPVEQAELVELPMPTQLAVMERTEALAREVFDWMSSQGMEPIPGRQTMPLVVTEQLRQAVADRAR